MTLFWFVVIIGVLVFVHELGHFLFAKMFNMKVNSFAIGFPPTLYKFKKGETEYKLNAIPLGGYVSIEGENYEEVDSRSGRSFANKPAWQQVAVLLAGVLFNFLFAWLAMSSLLFFGHNSVVPHNATSEDLAYFSDTSVEILAVVEGSPAEKVGIQAGDVAVAVVSDGVETDLTAPASGRRMSELVGSSDEVVLRVDRNGEILEFDMGVAEGFGSSGRGLGVAFAETGFEKMPFFTAISSGLERVWSMTVSLCEGFADYLRDVFRGDAGVKDLAGPVGIASYVGEAAESGFGSLVMLAILLSLNLVIFNLLPIPALDGGRIVFAILEGIRGKRFDAKFFNTANLVGFGFLILLTIVVTISDVIKLL